MGKVRMCAVCKKTREYDKISLFAVPKKNPERAQLWVDAIKHVLRNNLINPYKAYVCSEHFSKESYNPNPKNKHKLLPKSVPTLLLKLHQDVFDLDNVIKLDPDYTDVILDKCNIKKEEEEIDSTVKPFLCAECGKRFKNKRNLTQHLLQHSDKQYKCDVCQTPFVQKSHLVRHMASHSGIKPFKCEICNSTFTRSSTLKDHLRIHSGEKPYACKVCYRRFNLSSHVTRHMRKHTGEKPYKCKYCDRSFSQSTDLIKHTRTHVGKNIYQCKECPADFYLQRELNNHTFNDHYLPKQKLKNEPI